MYRPAECRCAEVCLEFISLIIFVASGANKSVKKPLFTLKHFSSYGIYYFDYQLVLVGEVLALKLQVT